MTSQDLREACIGQFYLPVSVVEQAAAALQALEEELKEALIRRNDLEYAKSYREKQIAFAEASINFWLEYVGHLYEVDNEQIKTLRQERDSAREALEQAERDLDQYRACYLSQTGLIETHQDLMQAKINQLTTDRDSWQQAYRNAVNDPWLTEARLVAKDAAERLHSDATTDAQAGCPHAGTSGGCSLGQWQALEGTEERE